MPMEKNKLLSMMVEYIRVTHGSKNISHSEASTIKNGIYNRIPDYFVKYQSFPNRDNLEELVVRF